MIISFQCNISSNFLHIIDRFSGHKASVKTLALSPDGDMFASGSEDGAVKIWDLGGFQVDETILPPENQQAILSEFFPS